MAKTDSRNSSKDSTLYEETKRQAEEIARLKEEIQKAKAKEISEGQKMVKATGTPAPSAAEGGKDPPAPEAAKGGKGKDPPAPEAAKDGKGKGKGPPAPEAAKDGKGKGKGPPAPEAAKGGKGGKGPPAPDAAKGAKGKDGKGKGKTPFEPRKPEVKPGVKTKTLFWQSFQLGREEAGAKTIWDDIHEIERPDIDTAQLESLFAENFQKHQEGGASGGAGPALEKKKPRTIQVLEGKRRQQVLLMLPRLPAVQETLTFLRQMQTDKLHREQIELLLSNVPCPDEIGILKQAQEATPIDDMHVFDTAENFLLGLMSIPQFKLRLEAWDFVNAFTEKAEVFRAAELAVSNAIRFMFESREMKHTLSVVLFAGNHLNGGTARGRADGFSIDTLLQLGALKSTCEGHKGTLVDYVVEQMHRAYPGELETMLHPRGSVQHVAAAAKLHIPDTESEVKLAQEKLARMRQAIGGGSDEAMLRFRESLGMCAEELLGFQLRFQRVNEKYNELVGWFHVRAAKKSSDEFFRAVEKFLADLSKAEQTLQERERAVERRRKAREASGSPHSARSVRSRGVHRIRSRSLPAPERSEPAACEPTTAEAANASAPA